MTARTLDHAYQAGRYARLAARGQDTCPRYGITPEARQEVAEWRRGWEDQDREMAAQRATAPQAARRIRT